MYIRKVIFLPAFFLMLIIAGCEAQLQVLEATRQGFSGGAAGSGGGNNYMIRLKKPKDAELKLTGVWMGGRHKGKLFDPRIDTESGAARQENSTIGSGVETFKIYFSERFAGEGNPRNPNAGQANKAWPAETDAPDWLPSDFNEGCILMFDAKGKKIFLHVTSFKDLPHLNYP